MERNETLVRFGIMGCANIARKICRAIKLSPNSTVHAIASRSLEKAEEFATEIGLLDEKKLIKIYGNYIELLDDPEVDAIYMPLPTSLHVKWAVLAASKKKHVLLEKPTALDSSQLDQILEACEVNGVQFMDGTMWYHHPRTAKMKEIMSDSAKFGHICLINCTSSFRADPEFLDNNIRVNPECDALGALGDLGWYCIGLILWAVNYELPTFVTALPEVTLNSKGIILACTASFHWEQEPKTNATFYCSFLSHVSMDLSVYGSIGSVHLHDLAIPYRENSASFVLTTGAKLMNLQIGWNVESEETVVKSQLPQEALMVQEFAQLVEGIKNRRRCSDKMWPEISRKTQLALDAVRKSIELGYRPVYL
ncbi:hypothetical protein BVRB_8g198140 [Beta vulgaris subsp. vulgaris]|uniref:uncharacterized oxidoreductase At4g09670 isoform X1 n=1 Tax=Beta vulgaris subsp. vulgaris TaxID=3555 RepID=UPI0005400AB4|nr:uncharacterized oxidoreductase At4g09670 isoform X1 [Beta vulgaris subsp. vulgaris]KMT03272.1 hypothetical protein BVRB_8g198140 [Beta vulgaris subsp. vulgaris]